MDILIAKYFHLIAVILVGFICFIVLGNWDMNDNISLPMLKTTLPAYAVITENDLVQKLVSSKSLPSNVIKDKQKLINKYYTLAQHEGGKPITEEQVHEIPESLVKDFDQEFVPIGVTINIDKSLGEKLAVGDLLHLQFVQSNGQISMPDIFRKILVLDVRPVSVETVTPSAGVISKTLKSSRSSLIIIALPENVVNIFLLENSRNDLIVTVSKDS